VTTEFLCALDGLTERIITYRFLRFGGTDVERLREKLRKAAGVAARVTRAIEADADSLIAREETLTTARLKAFKPHVDMLDAHQRDLDQLEDALKVISNDPLSDTATGSPAVGQPGNFPPGKSSTV
jgi:hypothetical protein